MKHEDIIINQENPFANCKLGREQYANILSLIVDSYANGFVLAINGEWGVGKTTFVKMWMQKLKNEGHKTIYFNAWENDFVSEPMVGILGELKSLITTDTERCFTSILEKAAKFSNKMIPTLAKGIARKYAGEEFTDLIEKGAEATTDLFEDEIKNYDKKKESLKTLKDDLCDFVAHDNGGKPIIFIIDELDRCRPDYAVEVLEKVKHFFSVQGIVFVLSIDKKQLGNSIRGYYGSDRINADEYLRRFIDIEYSLPDPSIKEFCEYLYQYFSFSIFFKDEMRCRYHEFQHDSELFMNFSTTLAAYKHLTLRQIEKLFAYTRLVLNTFSYNQYVLPDVLFLLIYIKYYENDLYITIKQNKLGIQGLVDKISIAFAHYFENAEEYQRQNAIYPIAKLIHCYNNSFERITYQQSSLITNDGNKLTFNSGTINEKALLVGLRYCVQDHKMYELTVKFLLQRIDLLETLKH